MLPVSDEAFEGMIDDALDTIPDDFTKFAPHLTTLLVLAFASQRLRMPAADGKVPTPPARQLSVCNDGDAGTVARISDADPEMLRYFDSVGISLDSRVRVLARRDFAGMISVAVERPGSAGEVAATTIDLGSPAAEAIWVVG